MLVAENREGAAIASKIAGDIYGLNMIRENIEDLPEEYYNQYDLIFSIATFEHIHKLPLVTGTGTTAADVLVILLGLDRGGEELVRKNDLARVLAS
jgi:hypothetical protein